MAIFTAISAAVTAVGSFITASAIGSFALRVAVGIGLSYAARALAGKPQKPVFSVEGKVQAGEDLPRSFMMGRSITAGSYAYIGTFGSTSKASNAYLAQVFAISDLPVGELLEFWVDGEKRTILYDDEEPNGFAVEEFKRDGDKDHMWVRFYDGQQAAADPLMVEKFGSHPTRPYQATRIGTGMAYAVVISRTDDDLFQGFPECKFVTSGAKIYDPSKDTSVGGSGPQRWANPATWGGDGDSLPAVQAYNVMRGIAYGGRWLYGLQNLPASRLPVANWIAAIAKCRLAVTTPDGPEPQYRAGGEVKVDVPAADGIEQLLTACHGRLAESGGFYKIAVGGPDAAVATIDDGVILSTEEQTFTPFFGLADTINGISARYPNQEEAWNYKDAPALYRPDYEAEDGARRLMSDVSFDLVPYPHQVQRLMDSALKEARRARRHTLTLPPEYGDLEPGLDTLSWSSVRNGYAAKQFRVDGVVDRVNCDVLVDVTEIDPTDYSFGVGDYLPVVTGPTIVVLPDPQDIQDFAVSGVVVELPDGRKRAAARLTWNGDDQDDVIAVVYELRVAATLAVIERGRSENVAAGEVVSSPQAIMALTAYEARGRFIPGGDRATLWSDWLPFTTPDARFGALDLYDAAIGWDTLAPEIRAFQSETEDALQAALAWRAEEIDWRAEALGWETAALDWRGRLGRDVVRPLLTSVQAVTIRTIDQDFANLADKQQLRVELGVAQGELKAGYTSLVTTAVRALGGVVTAVAQRVETLEVGLPGLASVSAVQALDVRVTTTEAGVVSLGTSVTTIQNALPGKADVAVTDGLDSRLTRSESGLVSQGSASRSIANTVSRAALLAVDQDFANHLDKLSSLGVTAKARTDLNTLITVERGRIDVASTALTQVQADLAGKASGLAFDQLTTTVTLQGASLTALSSAVTAVEALLPGKADGSAVAALTTRVGDVEGVVTSQAGALTAIQAELPGKASAAGLSSLTTTVTEQGLDLAAQGEAITGIVLALPDKADASALTALSGRVTDAEGVNTAQAGSLTTILAALPGKADVSVTDGLDARVTSNASGLTSVGRTARLISIAVNETALRGLDGDFAAFIGDAALRGVTATAFQQLATTIAVERGRINLTSASILAIQAALPGLASGEALNALSTTVTAQGGQISVLSTSLTTVQAALPGKAEASAVTALDGRVTSVEGVNTSQAGAITSINSSLGGKADASVVSALQTQVSQVELTAAGRNRVFRQSTAPTATAVGDLWLHTGESGRIYRASAVGSGSWVLSEDQRVPQLVTDVASQASAITGVQAQVNDVSASATFRASVVAAPSGFSSRIALQARTGTPAAWKTAGIYIDVPNGADPSRVAITADQFVLTDGTATAAPFEFSGGVAKMKEALIPTLTSGLIRSADDKLRIELDNGRIMIGN